MIVRYVPSWMPGMQWKKRVLESRKVFSDMVELPFRWVKKQMVSMVVL